MLSRAELLDQERALAALEREEIKRSFLAWCLYALAPLGLVPASHHRLLIQKLQDVADGKIARLLVQMPPGSAKSTYASKLFPAWLMARQTRYSIIGSSHTSSLAQDFSHDVMALIRDHGDMLGIELTSQSAELWRTSNGSRYRAAGVDGPIVGARASVAIVDDPVKSRENADSATYREKTWKWFLSDLRSRLYPGAAIVVIMTRWHEDDLGGRLLEAQSGMWDVLRLPAFADVDDPLGRAPGQVLGWDDQHYRLDRELTAIHAELEKSSAMREWSALYQQSPRPPEGSIFNTSMIPILEEMPAKGEIISCVRAWDLAATAKTGTRDPDYTVGLKLGRTKQNRFVVLDVKRLRGGPDVVERVILDTAEDDKKSAFRAKISLPQDPGQAGKSQAAYFVSQLAGHTVEATPESGDKATRASPVASQANAGNLSIVRAPWNRAFLEELAGFPSTAHDDQVDALSRAFSILGVARMRVVTEADLAAARANAAQRRTRTWGYAY